MPDHPTPDPTPALDPDEVARERERLERLREAGQQELFGMEEET